MKLHFSFSYRFLVGTIEFLMVDLVSEHIGFICPGLIFAKIGGGGIMGKAQDILNNVHCAAKKCRKGFAP